MSQVHLCYGADAVVRYPIPSLGPARQGADRMPGQCLRWNKEPRLLPSTCPRREVFMKGELDAMPLPTRRMAANHPRCLHRIGARSRISHHCGFRT